MTENLNNRQNPTTNRCITCRICGTESESGQKLFENHSEIEKIAVQICAFISIKLENFSTYPNWICPGCYLQFESTNEFIELIRNGQKKLVEQYGAPPRAPRKRKQKRALGFFVLNDHPVISSSENTAPFSKRVPKTPIKYKDSMQGNELENLFGVAKQKSSTSEPEPLAQIEDEDGIIIGEMLSTATESNGRSKIRYQCDFCKEVFTRELTFYNHLAEHTNVLYECRECRIIFETMSMYNDHIKQTNHSGLSITENPPDDEAETTNINAASISDINRKKKFVCLKCPKSFMTKKAMQRHLKTHNNSRPFRCDLCFKKFKRKSVLEVHKASHRKECLFKCEKCPKRFTHKSALQSHIRFVHEGEKPHSCSICKKNFSQKSNLIEHRRIHTGDRPFVCLKCGASFKTSSQCRLHQKTHVMLVKNEDNMLPKELKSPLKTYECEVCGKLFSQMSAMKKHLRIHTGEKPYACHLCPNRYSDPSNFKKHKQGHIEGKKQRAQRSASLLKSLKPRLTEIASTTADTIDSNSITQNTLPDAVGIVPASDSFPMLADVDTSLIGVINEVDANLWSSDLMITDIPNDENLIVQQQKQQEKLLNQLVCISYQDPMNPVNSKTTYYVVNQGNDQLGEISRS